MTDLVFFGRKALRRHAMRWPQAGVGVLVFAAIMAGFAVWQGPLSLPGETAPQAALAASRAAGAAGQALNDDQFGGFVISRHVPTYVDSCAELFGRMYYDLSLAVAGRKPDLLAALLADRAIGWTFLH